MNVLCNVILAVEMGEIKRCFSCFIISFQERFFTRFMHGKRLKLAPFGFQVYFQRQWLHIISCCAGIMAEVCIIFQHIAWFF